LDGVHGITIGVGNVATVDALIVFEDETFRCIAGNCQQSRYGRRIFFLSDYLRLSLKVLHSSQIADFDAGDFFS